MIRGLWPISWPSPTCCPKTIPSLPAPDAPHLLGRVRELTERAQAGTSQSFRAFRELLSLLLGLTVLAPEGGLRLAVFAGDPAKAVLGGWGGPEDPLPLRDGCFLRLSVTLRIEGAGAHRQGRVEASSYQYQADREGNGWLFRYDYLRSPRHSHPAAHLQVRAIPREPGRSIGAPLERIHFPTGRVSLEAVIRLLAEQFQVPCAYPPEIWRPVLALSERQFLAAAHQPLSGPDAA